MPDAFCRRIKPNYGILQLHKIGFALFLFKKRQKIKKNLKKSAKCIAKIKNKVYYIVKGKCRTMRVRPALLYKIDNGGHKHAIRI